MSKAVVFVSFDTQHDEDLYELLLVQSRSPSSGFAVSGGSRPSTLPSLENDSVRRRISEADQVIVICGEHTGASACVSAELELARQEQVPYFLLWGRRELMCTKPTGARPGEGMYSWTRQILQDQLTFTARRAAADAEADAQRDRKR